MKLATPIEQQIADFLSDADQTEWFKRRINSNIVAMIREGFVTYEGAGGPPTRRLRLTEKGKVAFHSRTTTATSH